MISRVYSLSVLFYSIHSPFLSFFSLLFLLSLSPSFSLSLFFSPPSLSLHLSFSPCLSLSHFLSLTLVLSFSLPLSFFSPSISSLSPSLFPSTPRLYGWFLRSVGSPAHPLSDDGQRPRGDLHRSFALRVLPSSATQTNKINHVMYMLLLYVLYSSVEHPVVVHTVFCLLKGIDIFTYHFL